MNNKLNSGILGLLLVVLIYLYISIESPNNMTGGMDCNLFKKQVSNLIKKDKIYGFLLGGYINAIIYVIVILVLAYYAFKYSISTTKHTGVVFFGNKYADGYTLGEYGEIFLRMYGNVSREKYMFADDIAKNPNSTKKSQNITQDDIDNYEAFLKQLREENDGILKKHIDKFCQIVKPCNDCLCPGNTDAQCQPTPEAQRILNHKNALGMGDKFFGEVPNCCCAKELRIDVPGCDVDKATIGATGVVSPPEPCKDKAGNLLTCTDDKYIQTYNKVLKPIVFAPPDSPRPPAQPV